MLEAGTPEHNLLNRVTSDAVRILNAAEQCKKNDCPYKDMIECSAEALKTNINKYGVEVKAQQGIVFQVKKYAKLVKGVTSSPDVHSLMDDLLEVVK